MVEYPIFRPSLHTCFHTQQVLPLKAPGKDVSPDSLEARPVLIPDLNRGKPDFLGRLPVPHPGHPALRGAAGHGPDGGGPPGLGPGDFQKDIEQGVPALATHTPPAAVNGLFLCAVQHVIWEYRAIGEAVRLEIPLPGGEEAA